ncbi:glycosyltransferase [Caenimonas sedimenti]|uniref:Glycosyltransferase n=1 Tax=Caenimonas sedimenti TaxID=2596921 RepID=A0A562ZV83_9BURK|nr:glycosyltransferase [Caenimonas sedimenti]
MQGQELAKRGWTVHTLCLDRPGASVDSRIAASAVVQLGPSIGAYGFNFRLEPWLRLNASKYSAILVHGMWGYHGYCVSKVARRQGFAYAIFLHGMLDPWFKQRYPFKHLKKWLYWPWGEYRVIRDAGLVLFTTAEELRLARNSFWLYKVRERLVGYGIAKPILVPAQRDQFTQAFPQLVGKRVLLFLSRLHEKKGCELLIRSFARVRATNPQLHLVIAGSGNAQYEETLKDLAQACGAGSSITFTGMLLGDLKWGAIQAAEVFVLPSYQENFGIALAEALVAGVPVVTTKGVNIWREIESEAAGLIGDATPQGIDSLLDRWLALSAAERKQMGERALQCFDRHFYIENVADNLHHALMDCAKEATGPYTYIGRAGRSLKA